jgi:hypothetical protein
MSTNTTNASAEQRLKNLGISLPRPPTPLGAYVEAVQSGNLLFLSGTLPVEEGVPKFLGRLGAELSIDDGRRATRLAALNALALAKGHLGSRTRHRSFWSAYSELTRYRLAWSSAWRASRWACVLCSRASSKLAKRRVLHDSQSKSCLARQRSCRDAAYAGIWELPALGAVTAPTAVLIRPDGYVAWVGDATQLGLADALTSWFGAPSA